MKPFCINMESDQIKIHLNVGETINTVNTVSNGRCVIPLRKESRRVRIYMYSTKVSTTTQTSSQQELIWSLQELPRTWKSNPRAFDCNNLS